MKKRICKIVEMGEKLPVIGKGCEIGKNVDIGRGTIIRSYSIICDDVVIGQDCKIGPHVLIQPGVVIGNNCKVHSHAFLCEGVTLEDEVFFSHHAATCNEKHPEAVRDIPWELVDENKILIKKGACVGTHAVILPGVTVGEGALIGVGAVVTKDVEAGTRVVGNPAVPIEMIGKIHGWLMFVEEHERQMEALKRIVDGKKK